MQILLITKSSALVREFNILSRHIVAGIFAIILILVGLIWCITMLTNQARDFLILSGNENRSNQRVGALSESHYEYQLHEIQAHLQEMRKSIERLNQLKESFPKVTRESDTGARPYDSVRSPMRSLDPSLEVTPREINLKLNQHPNIADESYGVRLSFALENTIRLKAQTTELQQVFAEHKAVSRSSNPSSPLLANQSASSGLGYRIDPISGKIAWHEGRDFPAPYGTLILATASGVVIKSGWSGGYGNTVEVRHPNGSITRYGHAQELLVKVGQSVSQSQPIAKVGSTGRSTGPHLHYEVL